MDTELFELCKEVHQLKPDWTSEYSFVKKHGELRTAHFYEEYQEQLESICPLYTSDYILGKLPWKVPGRINYCLMISRFKDDWRAWYDGSTYVTYGDTPLKAILKLTIALGDTGLLDPNINLKETS